MSYWRVGDRVRIKVAKHDDEYCPPAPSGSEGVVVGFTEMDYGRNNYGGRRPGIYTNDNYSYVKLDNGKEVELGTFNLEFVDPTLDEIRIGENRKRVAEVGVHEHCRLLDEEKFLRDLPETDFYEHDLVEYQSDRPYRSPEKGKITRVEYLKQYDPRKRNIITYSIKLDESGTVMWIEPERIKLIERGSIWKYYHNEPLSFDSIPAEYEFWKAVGKVKYISNPKTNNYRWSENEAEAFVLNDKAHGWTGKGSPLSKGSDIQVFFMEDEEFGKKVRNFILDKLEDEANNYIRMAGA